jgi:hypothetical protein
MHTLDQTGWTVLSPSLDTRFIYVSSREGSDLDPGTADRPIRTLHEAMLRVRDGFPDWILLASGDAFTEGFIGWNKSGRSASEPIVISTYGGTEPAILLTPTHGFYAWGIPRLANLVITDIDFVLKWNGQGEGPVGFNTKVPSENLLIEGCLFSGYVNSVEIDGVSGIARTSRIRRNVFRDPIRTDPMNGSAHVYFAHYDGVLIEENVFDNSDENETAGHYLSHAIYLGENNPPNNIVRGNIARNGGRTNYNIRSGGLIEDNLSIRGAQGITAGISYAQTTPPAILRDNVIIESRNNQSGQYLGFGISLDKVSGVTLLNNLICNATDGLDHKAIALAASVANVSITNNVIYNWGEAVRYGWDTIKLSGAPAGPVRITGNQVQQHTDSVLFRIENVTAMPNAVTLGGNEWFSARDPDHLMVIGSVESYLTTSPHSYPDASRNVPATFMAGCLAQTRHNWNSAFTARSMNNYLRAGFGMTRSFKADVNADGQLNVLDFNTFINAAGQGSAIVDLDSDGAITVMDFNAFLNAFSQRSLS